MNQDNKGHGPETKESGGFLHRLFGRGGHETSEPDAHSRPGTRTTLDLGDIQGFILRGYRMPMVRHSCSRWASPRRRASCSDGSSAGMSLTRRRSPRPKTGTWGSSRDQGTNSPTPRAASPIIA
jgi:hypothetical protein